MEISQETMGIETMSTMEKNICDRLQLTEPNYASQFKFLAIEKNCNLNHGTFDSNGLRMSGSCKFLEIFLLCHATNVSSDDQGLCYTCTLQNIEKNMILKTTILLMRLIVTLRLFLQQKTQRVELIPYMILDYSTRVVFPCIFLM